MKEYKKCECGCSMFLPTTNKKIKRCLMCNKVLDLTGIKFKVERATVK